ncbi:class II glutamine amidotransferase [Zavarzinia sp.]|uniref:class II glutamine amidotransferase n=1 Tax=Zavarzinia sp. TaxID=2027920 RepID=UPI003BB6FD82
MLGGMMATLCSRGPDSAGFAIYGEGRPDMVKLSLHGASEGHVAAVAGRLAEALGKELDFAVRHTQAIVSVAETDLGHAEAWLTAHAPEIAVVGKGRRMEIFKEVGNPVAVGKAFGIERMAGSHGVAHTRMATESAVTTDGAHPFSTGRDQCLVHNGSLSNHNSLRRELRREGVTITTENDSEVAAGYLTWRMRQGQSLGGALQSGLTDLDGFFTFVVGTESGFGVLRDPIACKPAVMAETESYVAFGSEYRSLVDLPGIDNARVWEPKPATVYFWERGQ